MLSIRTGTLIAALACATATASIAQDARSVMSMFGAEGVTSFSSADIASFSRPFDRMDKDRDGVLTEAEYVGGSWHFRGNKAGARGFLRAADSNGDGRVSRAEYVSNRIITDEAKEIFTRIDPDTSRNSRRAFGWTMTRSDFVGSAYLGDTTLAAKVFAVMDRDGNGTLTLPEYLIAYGRWARSGLPAAAIRG